MLFTQFYWMLRNDVENVFFALNIVYYGTASAIDVGPLKATWISKSRLLWTKFGSV